MAIVAWHLSLCLGCSRRRAFLACPVALRWCAAPRPVRSLSVLQLAVPTPWCLTRPRKLAPSDLLGGCAGHVEAGREPASFRLPVSAAEAAAVGSLRVIPVRGPAVELSLAGPSGVGLGLRALMWFACVDPVTDASGLLYCPAFDKGLGRCTRALSCGRRHRPFRVGGRHPWVPWVCGCACFLGQVGRAGLPGAVWCASLLPLALLGALFVCSATPGLGLPCSWLFLRFSFLCCAPLPSGVSWVPAPAALGLGVFPPPPPLFFFSFSLPPLPSFSSSSLLSCLFFRCLGFFFPFPPSSVFFFAVPWCAGRADLGWCALGCGACWCLPLWALFSTGARVRARSVGRCPLPAPLLFVLLPVVLRVPGGALLAALLFPVLPPVGAVWCCPPPPFLGALRGVFCFVGDVCWLCPPPPGWLWCPVLCFVVRHVMWCWGLWCVLYCARCCVACLRRVGFWCHVARRSVVLGRVVLFLLCFAVVRCCVVCRLFFCVVPCLSVVLRAVSVSVLCLCGALLVCLRRCPLCGALLPLRRWVLFPVVACCVCVCAVGPGCPLMSPGGSWWLLMSCFGCVLWSVPGCCAVLRRPGVVLLCAVLFRFALFGAVARCVVSWGAVCRPGVLCLPALCFVLSSRAVCVLLWCVAAWWCLPLCFVLCASWSVLLCVPFPLHPVRCCYLALLPLGALLPCAVPRGAVVPCGAVVSPPAALFGLRAVFVWFPLLEKLLQNLFRKKSFVLFFEIKIKFYTTQHTRGQQDHVCFCVLRATRRS